MKIKLVLFALLLFTAKTYSQAVTYDAASIPEQFKKDASKITQLDDIELEVSDIDYATCRTHKVITVMNDRNKSPLHFAVETDKFRKLGDFEAILYDAAGKQVGKYKQKDLLTTAIGEGLIDDCKTYYISIPATSFPATVEYKYEIRYKGSTHYPRFSIQAPNESVEFASYTAKVQKDLDLRFKEKNIHLDPAVSDDGKYKVYNWTVKNLPAVKYEEGAADYESPCPSIILAPNKFKIDEYAGDMTSWKNFGAWYADLTKGINVLSDDKKQFYRDLTKDAKTDLEKVKIIYAYLQKNFRYVSIQLGIGGLKPFPADFTDTKKYGDCKGLSNYMQAALQAVGIKSYQALINAEYNQEPADPGFPCDVFDHVILCVLLPKDSVWLECTSRTNDFGWLSGFTENRNALLITDEGGVLVPTPKSKSVNNTISGYTTIDMKEDGSGKTKTIFTTTGEYKQRMIALINEKTDEQKTYVIDEFGFKDPAQIDFHPSEKSGDLQTIIDQDLEKIPEMKAGSKMFLPTRAYSLWSGKLPKAEGRQQNYNFNFPFEKTDTTVFNLLDGYKADALPEAKTTKCPYASYSSKCWYDEKSKKVYSAQKIILNQCKIPASDYATIKKFFDDILIDNQQRIVIAKSN